MPEKEITVILNKDYYANIQKNITEAEPDQLVKNKYVKKLIQAAEKGKTVCNENMEGDFYEFIDTALNPFSDPYKKREEFKNSAYSECIECGTYRAVIGNKSYVSRNGFEWIDNDNTVIQPGGSMRDLMRWFLSGDTGLSSETIAAAMVGVQMGKFGPHVPSDVGDFGRCYRLLEIFPMWEKALKRVSDAFPMWTHFVQQWPVMKTLYEANTDEAFLELAGMLRDLGDYPHNP